MNWKKRIIFQFLLSIYPLSFFIGNNPELVTIATPDEVYELMIACFLLFVGNELLFFCTRQLKYNLLIYLGIILSYLWGPYQARVDGSVYVVFFVFMTGWGLLLFVINRLLRKKEIHQSLVFGLTVLSLLPYFQGLSSVWLESSVKSKQMVASSQSEDDHWAFREKPNIYLIVFDSMTSIEQFNRQSRRSEEARASASEYIADMEKHDFTVHQSASSNYGRTVWSMRSFFELDYHDGPLRSDNGFFRFTGSRFWQIFRNQGYKIMASSAGRAVTGRCVDGIDYCIDMPREDVLKSFIINGTPIKAFVTIIDRKFYKNSKFQVSTWLLASVHTKKLKHLELVKQELSKVPFSADPWLAYLHFTGTHPPNYFNSQCKKADSTAIFEQNSGEEEKVNFANQDYQSEYQCFLKQSVELAKLIRERDPKAWILIISDHGSGVFSYGIKSKKPWDITRQQATFQVMRSYHCPAACKALLQHAVSNVNLARALMNSLIGQNKFPLLPEKSSTFGFYGAVQEFEISK